MHGYMLSREPTKGDRVVRDVWGHTIRLTRRKSGNKINGVGEYLKGSKRVRGDGGQKSWVKGSEPQEAWKPHEHRAVVVKGVTGPHDVVPEWVGRCEPRDAFSTLT